MPVPSAQVAVGRQNDHGRQTISSEQSVFLDTTYDEVKVYLFPREDAAAWMLIGNFGFHPGYFELQQLSYSIEAVETGDIQPVNVEKFFVRSLKPKTGTELNRAEFYWNQVPNADGYIIRFAKTLYNFTKGVEESYKYGRNDLLYGSPIIINGGSIQTYELPITTELYGGIIGAITSFRNHTVNGQQIRIESSIPISFAYLPGNITGVASDSSPPLYLQMVVDQAEVNYVYNCLRLNNVLVPTPPVDQPAGKEELADADSNGKVGSIIDNNFERSQLNKTMK